MVAANEMFTQLPVSTNANMTDIIAAVQGYVSPSVLGTLNQATLQQVFNLFLSKTPSSLVWSTVVASSISMVTNNGYIVNYSIGAVTLTLPAVSSVGDELIILGLSASGYSIAQLTGQQVIIAPSTTTLGVGGSLTTTNRYDAITLRCMVANSIWGVSSNPQGTFTIV